MSTGSVPCTGLPRWYRAAGLLTDAVPHAVAAGCATTARCGLARLALRGGKVPSGNARGAQAWSLLSDGDLDAVEPWLDAAASAMARGIPPLSDVATSPGIVSRAAERDAA